MKALILNSGIGLRLLPLTRCVPKALVKIGGKPLLGHQIDNLIECDIRHLIITTGPLENKIRKYVQQEYPNTEVVYVKNPRYRATNYIYSMWLTRRLVDNDIILLHGDLFFETKLLRRLIDDGSPNCVLVNRTINPPRKDFKAVIRKGRVTKIGVGFSGRCVFFSAPLYKFSRSDFTFWLDEIEKAVKNGDVGIYAEDVFNKISDKIMLSPLYFDEEICLEIDTKKDLQVLQNRLRMRGENEF